MSEDKALRKTREKLEKALETNKNDDAIKWLAELIKLEPNNVRWPHKLGDLQRKLGRNPQAVEAYANAVDLYAEQGFIARAIAMAKAVLNLDPTRIDVLERVDPSAAHQLRSQLRQAPPTSSSAARHPMLLEDEPPASTPGPKRHPMILDDSTPPLPMPADKRQRTAAPAPKPPAPPRHPNRLDDLSVPSPPTRPQPRAPAPVPPPLPSAAPRAKATPPPLVPGASRRPVVTLDRLSLPPTATNVARRPPASPLTAAGGNSPLTAAGKNSPLTAAGKNSPLTPAAPAERAVAEIYSRALDKIDELESDDSAPLGETRFSDAPPDPLIEVELNEIEIEVRESAPAPAAQSSLPPPPPSAARLAKLPLFPLFSELPKEALSHMVAGSELLELEDGALVLQRGDDNDALYGVLEGSVSIAIPNQPVQILAEGDVFGEACLLQDEPSRADVVVQGKLVALRVPREVLNNLIEYHPPLAELLLALLTRRLLGNLLHASPLFQEFDAAGKLEIGNLFEVRRAPAGSALSVVGKRTDGLYISLTGTLAIRERSSQERIGPPGSMLGQNTLLSNSPSNTDVTTRVDMIVLRLSAQSFTRVAMQYPTLLARLADLSTDDVVEI